MQYWIILGVLIVIAVALIIAIIAILASGRKADYEDDDIYIVGEDDSYDDEYESPRRRKSAKRDEPEVPVRVSEAKSRGTVKKQWKIILENLETWEKYTFVFYDNIGIGRGKKTPEFEKYITVQGDPRVSKLHCAIIRDGDKLYLKDMGARNGTYLNGHQVQRSVVIQKEDVIGIGETKIEVKKILRERD